MILGHDSSILYNRDFRAPMVQTLMEYETANVKNKKDL